MPAAISHLSLKEIILERLRQEIVAGVYKPGTHLIEQSLAIHYGVSRGPVREALAQLEQEGLVAIQPRRGTVVTELSLAEAWEIYTLRGHLEQLGVRFARDHWTAGRTDQLAALVTEMERLGSHDWLAAAHLDQQFHGVIIRASGNGTLIQTYQALDTKVLAGFLVVKRYLPQVPVAMAGKHRPLAEALAQGDFYRAEILALEHWSDTAYRFRSLIHTKQQAGGNEGAISDSRGDAD